MLSGMVALSLVRERWRMAALSGPWVRPANPQNRDAQLTARMIFISFGVICCIV
jgi:hypothetical protein